jgi:hypothetical protein
MQILARTTTKHKDKDNKEIWTAPTMVTVEDPETRWEVHPAPPVNIFTHIHTTLKQGNNGTG